MHVIQLSASMIHKKEIPWERRRRFSQGYRQARLFNEMKDERRELVAESREKMFGGAKKRVVNIKKKKDGFFNWSVMVFHFLRWIRLNDILNQLAILTTSLLGKQSRFNI